MTFRLLLAALALLLAGTGCQPDAADSPAVGRQSAVDPQAGGDGSVPESSAEPAPGSAEDARRLLQASFAHYRSLQSYSDLGELVLEAPDSVPVVTPFRVAWERPNRLALAIHQGRGCWTSTTFEAICFGDGNPFPQQRLVRPLPDKIELDWVVNDNLGGLVTNPLGLPIALELLLSDQSFAGLVEGATKLEFLQRDSVEGRACDRIRVDRSGLSWVLWIDRENALLRRVELPPQLFYPQLTGTELLGVRCHIELRGAQANPSIDWRDWQVAERTDDVRVRRFVIPPPIASTRILGKTLDAFDLRDSDGNLLLDAAEPKRPITALCWIGEDPVSESLVRELMKVQKALVDRELAPRCQILLVARESAQGLSKLLPQWNCDLPLAIDRQNLRESVFEIPGEPSLVLLDRDRRVQISERVTTPASVAALPGLIQRIDAKEDLASRQLQQDTDNQARYVAALHRVAIDADETSKLDAIREFQFALHGLARRDWRTPLPEPLVSAGAAWHPAAALGLSMPDPLPFSGSGSPVVVVALDEKGTLHAVDDLGKLAPMASIEIDQADGAIRIHTAIDPWEHRWVAVVPEGLPRFWIAPLPPGPRPSNLPLPAATTYNTQDGEFPVAYAWTALQHEPGLALATSESRLLVIQPKTEQRLDAVGEQAMGIAPGLDATGRLAEWNAVAKNGRVTHIRSLGGASGMISDAPLEARLDRLPFEPVPGQWLWGSHGKDVVTFSLASLITGETGVVVCNPLYQALRNRPLTVRPEQARLLSAARLPDGTLYGLALGPNRVLHLFSADLSLMDQLSFGSRILAASIYPSGEDLKLVVALSDEVSAWTIDVPAPASQMAPAGEPVGSLPPSEIGSSSSESPAAAGSL